MALQNSIADRLIASSNWPGADLVDTKTAAKILGLRNHHTLEVWRSEKRYPELRYHRVGGAVRYRAADLESFLQAHAVGGDPGHCGDHFGDGGDGRRKC